jgi:hypothetical protein
LYSTTRQELESLLGTPDLVFTIQGNEITIIGYRDRPNRLFDISIKSSQSDYFARIKDTKFNIMIKNEVITLVYKV